LSKAYLHRRHEVIVGRATADTDLRGYRYLLPSRNQRWVDGDCCDRVLAIKFYIQIIDFIIYL
jgi:hypothetical protein